MVESNHQRAEGASTHKVAAEHVDPARLSAGPLPAGPGEQQRQRLARHGLHALERMEQDVGGVLRQVQAADEKRSCQTDKHASGSCSVFTGSPGHPVGLVLPGLSVLFLASR